MDRQPLYQQHSSRPRVRSHLTDSFGDAPDNVDNGAREMLRMLAVPNAMHTGKVRADPLKCDPNTRQAVIEDIIVWIEDGERTHSILFLCGPAGIGKSAIAKTIADRLDELDSGAKVAGSFFFFKGDPQRSNLDKFVLTIAYQLSLALEEVGVVMDEVIEQDLQVLSADIAEQWKKLVVETVNAVQKIPPAVIIVDGLDECGDESQQKMLLDLIASCGPHFPIAFLITGRPEPHIVDCFNADPLFSFCRPTIDLADCKDYREMELFIRSSFSRIYTRHRDALQAYAVNGVWPSEYYVSLIAHRADGQYIYPVTIFKYIDEEYENPQERLQACLNQLPEALSALDMLYTQILRSSHPPSDYATQTILFLIIILVFDHTVFGVTPHAPNMHIVSAITDLEPAECRSRLKRLHSVINVPDQDDEDISLHHLSFADFLFDPTRGLRYCLEKSIYAARVISLCLTALEEQKQERATLYLITRCWWRCSGFISHTSIPSDLVSQMQHLDFPQVLGGIGAFGITFGTHPLEADYKAFVSMCLKWVTHGRELTERQPILMHRTSNLLMNFPPDAFEIARVVRRLKMSVANDERYPSCRRAPTLSRELGSLSWKGLYVVLLPLLAYRYRNELDQVTDFTCSELWQAAQDAFKKDHLMRTLPEEDVKYLRSWVQKNRPTPIYEPVPQDYI
ncbi:hypothetical protein AX16_006173 [Volvariella volvacea WC 439]|nr:hypothetical protein AX16_006173 [Volvariella volvacea WC 439]